MVSVPTPDDPHHTTDPFQAQTQPATTSSTTTSSAPAAAPRAATGPGSKSATAKAQAIPATRPACARPSTRRAITTGQPKTSITTSRNAIPTPRSGSPGTPWAESWAPSSASPSACPSSPSKPTPTPSPPPASASLHHRATTSAATTPVPTPRSTTSGTPPIRSTWVLVALRVPCAPLLATPSSPTATRARPAHTTRWRIWGGARASGTTRSAW